MYLSRTDRQTHQHCNSEHVCIHTQHSNTHTQKRTCHAEALQIQSSNLKLLLDNWMQGLISRQTPMQMDTNSFVNDQLLSKREDIRGFMSIFWKNRKWPLKCFHCCERNGFAFIRSIILWPRINYADKTAAIETSREHN